MFPFYILITHMYAYIRDNISESHYTHCLHNATITCSVAFSHQVDGMSVISKKKLMPELMHCLNFYFCCSEATCKPRVSRDIAYKFDMRYADFSVQSGHQKNKHPPC